MNNNKTFEELAVEARKTKAYKREGAILQFTEAVAKELHLRDWDKRILSSLIGKSPRWYPIVLS